MQANFFHLPHLRKEETNQITSRRMSSFEAIKICTLRIVQPSLSLQLILHALCIIWLRCCYFLLTENPSEVILQPVVVLKWRIWRWRNVWGNKLIQGALHSMVTLFEKKVLLTVNRDSSTSVSIKTKYKMQIYFQPSLL